MSSPQSGPPERRNTVLILAGQAVTLLGDYVALLALPLFVYHITESSLDLGLTTAFETLPTVLFGFAVGVVLDRVPIKRALVIADLGRAAAFAALAAAAASGEPQVWMAFAVAFVAGSMAVAFDSGFQAWMPSLLADEALVGVNTGLQVIRTSAWTLGPLIAGVLATQAGGFQAAFGLNAATFCASAVFVIMLRETYPRPHPEHLPWLQSFRAGIRYLWQQPHLRVATGAAMAFNLTFAPMEALLVALAEDRLDISGRLIGWFFGGQALLGALGLAAAPVLARRLGLGRVFVIGLFFLGFGFFSLNLAAPAIADLSPIASTVASIFPAGLSVAGVSFANVAFTTLRQRIPPAHLLGRVTAASRTLAWALLPIGAAVGGAAGEAFGVSAVYGGASAALLVVALSLGATSLWRLRIQPRHPDMGRAPAE
jgi:hypothetical protein